MNVAYILWRMRRLARRALEEEGLVGQLQRIAVHQVDLHLRGAVLVDQRVDLDLLGLAELVDVVEQRVELVDRRDAVGLPADLRPARAADRRLQRIVRVDVGLDQEELELRRHDRLPAARFVQLEHSLSTQRGADIDRPAVGVDSSRDHLRGRLGGPGHEAHRVPDRPHVDVDSAGLHRHPRRRGTRPSPSA